MHNEYGINYTFKKNEAGAENFKQFDYFVYNKWTDSRGGPCVVYCLNETEFDQLLKWWSRTPEWSYAPDNSHDYTI